MKQTERRGLWRGKGGARREMRREGERGRRGRQTTERANGEKKEEKEVAKKEN